MIPARGLLLALTLTLLLPPHAAFAVTPLSGEDLLKTRAERSDFRNTDAAVGSNALLEQLAARSPDIRLQTFGLTPEGRPMTWVLATRDADTAEPEDLSGTTRLLLVAGIHAGEIEGKDAGIMLLRDLTNNEGHR